ncbi:MAG: hypothetical protein Q7U84_04255 [Polynucleobacter sp.]|nr:hypothetical protein [Polynucleobacter sp.]
MSKPRPSPWGRVRPTDITQAAVLVAQTSQWPVLYGTADRIDRNANVAIGRKADA